MHFQAAALLIEHGITPQSFDTLAEEYDLLTVHEAILHDPETASENPAHRGRILKGPIVWLPGTVPYGNLWKDTRVGASTVCQSSSARVAFHGKRHR